MMQGPDMRCEITRSGDWMLSADAPAQLLKDVADLKSGAGKVPWVIRFPGFDPLAHLSREAPGTPVGSGDPPSSLADNSHVDTILLLSGGAASGIDEHGVWRTPMGTAQEEVMNAPFKEPGPPPAAGPIDGLRRLLGLRTAGDDAEPAGKGTASSSGMTEAETEAQRLAAHGALPGEDADGMIVDTVIVRQMRAVPVTREGRPTNEFRVEEERRATLRRAYPPGARPSRRERINNLLEDASCFARVQAYNLGFAVNPPRELMRGGG